MKQNGLRVGWLLTEIESHIGKRVSPETCDEILQEVAAHLDAAIQVRLELGMAPEEAEREAVTQFGQPKGYVSELLSVHEQPATSIWKGDRKVMQVFWIGTIWSIACLTSCLPQVTNTVGLITGVVFVWALSAASYRSKLVRPLPLAKASFAAYLLLAFALTLTTHNLHVNGDGGSLPDWQTAEVLTGRAQVLDAVRENLTLLDKSLKLHIGAQGPTSAVDRSLLLTKPNLSQAFLASAETYFDYPSEPVHLDLVPTTNLAEATRAWQETAQTFRQKLINAQQTESEQIAAIEQARSSFLLADLPENLGLTFAFFPFLFLLTALINFTYGSIGKAMAGSARSRRRRVA